MPPPLHLAPHAEAHHADPRIAAGFGPRPAPVGFGAPINPEPPKQQRDAIGIDAVKELLGDKDKEKQEMAEQLQAAFRAELNKVHAVHRSELQNIAHDTRVQTQQHMGNMMFAQHQVHMQQQEMARQAQRNRYQQHVASMHHHKGIDHPPQHFKNYLTPQERQAREPPRPNLGLPKSIPPPAPPGAKPRMPQWSSKGVKAYSTLFDGALAPSDNRAQEETDKPPAPPKETLQALDKVLEKVEKDRLEQMKTEVLSKLNAVGVPPVPKESKKKEAGVYAGEEPGEVIVMQNKGLDDSRWARGDSRWDE